MWDVAMAITIDRIARAIVRFMVPPSSFDYLREGYTFASERSAQDPAPAQPPSHREIPEDSEQHAADRQHDDVGDVGAGPQHHPDRPRNGRDGRYQLQLPDWGHDVRSRAPLCHQMRSATH